MAAPTIGATDLFGLGSNFSPQSSDSSIRKDRSTAFDEAGDLACESMINQRTEYETPYEYCGTDIVTDLGTILTQFGEVASSKVITGISISQERGSRPQVTIRGVQYPSAVTAIGNADVSSLLPSSWGGVTVPTLGGVTIGDATPISLSVDIGLNHVAEQGADGEVFVAENINFLVEASAEYLGVPSAYTSVTGYTTDESSESDSNNQHERASWGGHAWVDAN